MARSHQYKVVILGKSGAGKSTLIGRLNDDRFYEKSDPDTTANVYRQDYTKEDGTKISVNLWDLAGNSRFESLNQKHIKDSDAVIICVEPKELFDANHIIQYIKISRQHQADRPITIIITKSDLTIDESLQDNLIYFAKQNKLQIEKSSAKNGTNIRDIFQKITNNFSSNSPHEEKILRPPLLLYLHTKIKQLVINNQQDVAFQYALMQLHKQLEKLEQNDTITSHAIATATLTLLNDLQTSTKDIQTLFYLYQKTCAPYHKKTSTLSRLIGVVVITGMCAVLGIALGVGIGFALGITTTALLYSTIACTATTTSIVGITTSSVFFFKPNAMQTALKNVVQTGEQATIHSI